MKAALFCNYLCRRIPALCYILVMDKLSRHFFVGGVAIFLPAFNQSFNTCFSADDSFDVFCQIKIKFTRNVFFVIDDA